MDECGMKNWSHDIPEGNRIYFTEVLNEMKTMVQPRILEIGSFTGTSIMAMKEILPKADCICIDNWGMEDGELDICRGVSGDKNLDMKKVRDTFLKNTDGKVKLIEMDSAKAMSLLQSEGKIFDFIYVDGSHRADDTLVDMFMAWPLLKKGGVMGIDDYQFIPPDQRGGCPAHAINYFMNKMKGQYDIISINYRVFLRKMV